MPSDREGAISEESRYHFNDEEYIGYRREHKTQVIAARAHLDKLTSRIPYLMQRTLRTITLQEASVLMCGTILQTNDATGASIPIDRPDGTLPMMVIPPAIGVVLVLAGLALFVVDLSVTNHGLLTAGAILALVAGGLVLFEAGVPYSGILLGVVVVVAMLMGGVLFGVLGSLRTLKGRPAITGREGMIGEVGTVRSPIGVESEGWVFVHGERWRAVLAFAPEGASPGDREPIIGVGSKVAVVSFGDGGVVQVVPIELPRHSRDLDATG